MVSLTLSRTYTSTRTLIVMAVALYAINPVYFTLYVPLSSIHHPFYFFSSYALVALAEAVVILLNTTDQRKYQISCALIVSVGLVSLIGLALDSNVADFTFSVVPAYFTGAAIGGTAVLIYRLMKN